VYLSDFETKKKQSILFQLVINNTSVNSDIYCLLWVLAYRSLCLLDRDLFVWTTNYHPS